MAPNPTPRDIFRKKQAQVYRGSRGGVELFVYEFGQSYERQMKYAEAFARYLRDNGITAYAGGRLD